MKSISLSISIKTLTLLSAVAVILFSCNYIIKQNNYDEFAQLNSRININKEEAKLLVKASKNNLDILELCETIKVTETEDTIKQLASNLEETHTEILENYKELAREKLISIPNNTYFDYSPDITNKQYDAEFAEASLKQILNKIDKQMQILDTLSNTSDNSEFKVLAIRDQHVLKLNKTKIENTLSHLNQSI